MDACLIIDDPLLSASYGYLNYQSLLNLMDEYDFHTTIAFIPYNWNRSDPDVVKLFLERPDRYSLCIHGCDHSEKEFGTCDPAILEAKYKASIYLMEKHKELTGIAYDNVMVFPQGVFSSCAIKSIKDAGFMAVINTTVVSVDGEVEFDFPIFQRYYAEDVLDNIKPDYPLFIAEHHGCFKDGGRNLFRLVTKLNEMGAKWDRPINILKKFGCIDTEYFIEEIKYKPNFNVKVRRLLSELRDNYLNKNPFLKIAADKAAILIKYKALP